MGYRELFLILGGVVMMSMITSSVNRTFYDGREALQEAQIAHLATSVGRAFIEESRSKLYDFQLQHGLSEAGMPANFVSNAQMGPGAGEYYPDYDDVDDFHGFSETIDIDGMDFDVNITVGYVEDSDLETYVSNRTFFKMTEVVVTSEYLQHPVTLKQVWSYYGIVQD